MNETNNILVAVADDHPIVIDGITFALNEQPGIEVVIRARHGKELIKKLERKTADIVLMDMRMPEMDGFEATKYIKEHYPCIKIIGLSMLEETKFIVEMVEAGAHGFVSKGSTIEELIETILKVMRHGHYYNQCLTKRLYEC